MSTYPHIYPNPDGGSYTGTVKFQQDADCHFTWLLPNPSDEDDNIHTAKKLKKRWIFDKIRYFLTSVRHPENALSSAPIMPTTPPERGFRWLISSVHLPGEYHGGDLPFQAPWCVVFRCLLEDLPSQLQEETSLNDWRHRQVEEMDDVKTLARYSRFRYRRRLVFSEEAQDDRGFLTGDWHIAAYVLSDDRDWLEKVDVTDLITFDTLHCVRAFELLQESLPKLDIFYLLKWEPSGLKQLLFDGPATAHKDRRPMDPLSPAPARLRMLVSLMNNEARSLFYESHEALKHQQVMIDGGGGLLWRPPAYCGLD